MTTVSLSKESKTCDFHFFVFLTNLLPATFSSSSFVTSNHWQAMETTRFRTTGLQGYSVKFSPYDPTLLAAATCSNFGLAGNHYVTSQSFFCPGGLLSQLIILRPWFLWVTLKFEQIQHLALISVTLDAILIGVMVAVDIFYFPSLFLIPWSLFAFIMMVGTRCQFIMEEGEEEK